MALGEIQFFPVLGVTKVAAGVAAGTYLVLAGAKQIASAIVEA